MIFEGCYWACPYEGIAFDYTRKQFLNVSKMYKLLSLDEAKICGDTLILCGTDKDGIEKQIAVSKQDIILGMNSYGQSDLDSDFNN